MTDSRATGGRNERPTNVPPELERISAGRLRRAAREAAMRQVIRNGSTDGAADLPPVVPGRLKV